MDIICAKCGKHFNSVESARNHRGHCKETEGGDILFVPTSISIPKISGQNNSNRRIKDTNKIENIYEIHCPLRKTGDFPCPRCCYSQSESERKAYFNTITWWYCRYPNIVKLSMLQPEDII
jgi:hypothetical protein